MSDPQSGDDKSDDRLTVPLAEEQAVIDKRTVETGRVRIVTHVEQRAVPVREALRRETVTVERVPIGSIVETAPEVRREGDTIIYPIVEETLVIEKRLLLKEEIRVTCTDWVDTVEQQVTLRSVHADIQRTPSPTGPDN